MEKTLIVYYSFEGNVDFLAGELKKQLPLDLERLVCLNEPPKKGLGKFLRGGKSALMKDDPGLQGLSRDVRDYQTIVLAYPVWAGTFPPAIRSFIEKYPMEGKNIILIGSSASGNAKRSFEQASSMLSNNRIIATYSFQNPLKNPDHAKAILERVVKEIRSL